MYNGRQWHIQTEPYQDQSAKEESVHGHRNGDRRGGGGASRSDKNKDPSDKNENTLLAEREMYKEKKIMNAMLHLVPRL